MVGRTNDSAAAWGDGVDGALVLSFRLLTGLLRNLDDAVLVQDTSGTVVFVNDAAARLCGFASAEEMHEASILSVLRNFQVLDGAGRHLPLSQLPAQRVLRGEEEVEATLRWRIGAAGAEHLSVVKATPVFDDAGAVQFVLSVFQDITERNRAEEAVRESEARFRALVERGKDAVALIDAGGHFLASTPASTPLLGYERADVVGRDVLALVHPDDLAAVIRALGAIRDEPGASATAEYRMRHKDGDWRWMEGMATNLLDEPAVRAIVVNYRDISDRKRAEAALRDSDARFRSLVQNVSDIIKLLDAGGTILYQSPSVERVLGYPPERRIGSNIFTDPVVHPDDLDRKRRFLAAAVATPDRTVTGEFRLRHADGSWRDIEAVGINLLADPLVGGIVATYRDVTDRKRAEARERFLADASVALAEALDYESALHLIARLAVPAIADWCSVEIVAEDGAIHPLAMVHADPAKAALSEQLRRRYPPLPTDHFGPQEVVRTGEARLMSNIPDAVWEQAARDAEHLRLMRGFGLRSSMIVPLTARGKQLGALTLVSETAGRYGAADLAFAGELARRAAVAIDNAALYRDARAAEERYRGLFAGTADAVLVADAEGRYLDANPAMTALVGYTVAELRAMRIGDLAADSEVSRGRAERAARDGVWRGELELRRKDGSLVPVEGAIATIALPTGTVYLATWRDITERRERERERQEFLSMVAHELRTPLAVMKTYVDLMRRRGAYNERQMEIVARQTGRVDRLLTDALDTSRLDAHRLELRPSEVELTNMVRHCVAEAEGTTESHAVRVEVPGHPITGWWDADRVCQVIQNLLMNAIKYSDGGDIVLRAQDVGDHARVSITDRGIGIPAEALPHLFDRFYRAENARTGSAQGLGLGLYIAKSLVEAHGGEMWVESVVGEGSTFTFTLPYKPGADAR